MTNVASKMVRKLAKEHNTSNPIIIAENLNIAVEFAPFHQREAVFVNIHDTPMIIINEKFRHDPILKFLVAHELFHAVHHKETVAFYHGGYNVKGKLEREANQFATYLCLVGAVIYEGQSNYEVMRVNNIPPEMEGYLRSV